MPRVAYELIPRDMLFFRDARPMDVDKDRADDAFNVGHGARWPLPTQLFSAAIRELIRDSASPERERYGTVPDLHVTGPFPFREQRLFLPMPLDWDMKLVSFDPSVGTTDIPAPLTAGFADRVPEKKSYPRWIAVDDYRRYLEGVVGRSGDVGEPDMPCDRDAELYATENRLCTTLDAATGASRRVAGRHTCGQYAAEYLRLGKNVKMLCEIETERACELAGRDVRFGGQGGTVRFKAAANGLTGELATLPHGTPSRFVRWTLLTSALFNRGWYPNWLEATANGERTGRVMLPMDKVCRRPGESRAAYRARMKVECRPFVSARLVAACIGKAVAFAGYAGETGGKPTDLAVPAGSSYVFACDTVDEAEKLSAALNLKALSDLGEKGFGLGVTSYVAAPEPFAAG